MDFFVLKGISFQLDLSQEKKKKEKERNYVKAEAKYLRRATSPLSTRDSQKMRLLQLADIMKV